MSKILWAEQNLKIDNNFVFHTRALHRNNEVLFNCITPASFTFILQNKIQVTLHSNKDAYMFMYKYRCLYNFVLVKITHLKEHSTCIMYSVKSWKFTFQFRFLTSFLGGGNEHWWYHLMRLVLCWPKIINLKKHNAQCIRAQVNPCDSKTRNLSSNFGALKNE